MKEALGKRLEHEKSNGNIPSLRIVQGVKRINHSPFVDDILLLGRDSQS
jgi:hypothetical protein